MIGIKDIPFYSFELWIFIKLKVQFLIQELESALTDLQMKI